MFLINYSMCCSVRRNHGVGKLYVRLNDSHRL